jgi:hypothetical protein
MPAKSKAQQHLMAAAAHGASFPMAKKVRASMTKGQMHDFAATKTTRLPKHAPDVESHGTMKGRRRRG